MLHCMTLFISTQGWSKGRIQLLQLCEGGHLKEIDRGLREGLGQRHEVKRERVWLPDFISGSILKSTSCSCCFFFVCCFFSTLRESCRCYHHGNL